MVPYRAPEPVAPASAMIPARYRVARRHRETHDTLTLELEPVEEGLEAFAPGQFAMLYAFGAGEAPISISGEAAAGRALVHTIRDVGAVTGAICALPVGAELGVRGPFGSAWPLEEAEGRDVLVMAGGIGLAPLRPLIHRLLAARERFGRIVVAYGGRSAAELLYLAELERWRARLDVDVEVTVDSADGGWRGRVGVVTTLVPRAELDIGAVAFLCGPEVMMRFSIDALRDAGLAAESIHVSMERSMKCAIGHCGHCQLRERFVCKDGPVFTSAQMAPLMRIREL